MKHPTQLRSLLGKWVTLFTVAALAITILPFMPAPLSQAQGSERQRVFVPVVFRPGETQTRTVTSSESGVVSTPSGVGLQVLAGTIPQQSDGNNSTVNFSIETGVEPPAPLPADMQQVSSVIKFGPDGFTFANPVGMVIPVPTNADPSQLKLLRYAPDTNSWVVYPFVVQNNAISAAGYDLGYVVVTSSAASGASLSNYSWINGGLRWNRTSCPEPNEHLPCWYNFSIISSTATIPSGPIFNVSCSQSGGALRCIVMKTGSDPGGANPLCTSTVEKDDVDPLFYSSTSSYCIFPLPLGSYQLCAEAWEAPRVIPGPTNLRRWTYSVPVQATVDRPIIREYPSFDAPWRGTRPIAITGGVWQEGGSCPGPNPTIPVGTGELQATLTWVNVEERNTDLDLHLYGPNGLHIYYRNLGPVNNLRLDRDWLRELGNAVENIYSVGPIPSGEYRLTVHLYDGSPTTYSVRFIFGGSVRTYTNSIDYNNREHEIVRFRVP